MLSKIRRFNAVNFPSAVLLTVLWLGWRAITALHSADPTRLRIQQVPLGAAFLALVYLGVLALYARGGELMPLVRVFAGILGVVQLLQSVVVALIAHLAYGESFGTGSQVFSWYVCATLLAFAALGSDRRPRTVGATAAQIE